MKLPLLALLALLPTIGLTFAHRPDRVPPQEPMRPAPQHERLQKLAGTWDAVLVAQGPDGKELRSRGTLTTVKHTAFHTVDRFEGEFMGARFVGQGINGYCPVRKHYFTFWTDSMTPSPMTLTGSFDAGKREQTMSGECFGMSGKIETCRTVATFQDDDHYAWELFGAGPDGKEMRHLRIEYTRRK